MDKDTLWGVKQIVEEFGEYLTGNEEKNKKEVHRLRNELDEVYAKAKAWDKLYEYVSTTPYDGIDIDTLKNRLDRFLNESGE